jgi:GNAT superfamily N-acetyltransferase
MTAMPHSTDLSVTVRVLHRSELPGAVRVLALGLHDNPSYRAFFGADRERRLRLLAAMFTGQLRAAPELERICAVDEDGRIVGFAASTPLGICRTPALSTLRVAARVGAESPRMLYSFLLWHRIWGSLDPDTPHSHLGPVAVEPKFQGRGIGSKLMEEYLRRVDAFGYPAYLETDRKENLPFYRNLGFSVVGDGVMMNDRLWPGWLRSAAGKAGSDATRAEGFTAVSPARYWCMRREAR